MQKKLFFVMIFAVVIIFIVLGIFKFSKINVSSYNDTHVVFNHGDQNVNQKLDFEDEKIIKDILNNKIISLDFPACGFDENKAILFNNGAKTFCVANDGDGFLYWKERDRCIVLSDEELTQLHSVLEKYGFVFPCV